MSPVRLGPVIKEANAGGDPKFFLRTSNASARSPTSWEVEAMTTWCGGKTESTLPPEEAEVTRIPPVCATRHSHPVTPASHTSRAAEVYSRSVQTTGRPSEFTAALPISNSWEPTDFQSFSRARAASSVDTAAASAQSRTSVLRSREFFSKSATRADGDRGTGGNQSCGLWPEFDDSAPER